MASKFMAFASIASTSSASIDNEDSEHERDGEHIEMNSTQYPNYQSNHNHETTNDPNPYGAVDPDDDLDENFEEKSDENVGYRKFIYNNSEQFKSICGGLLLLMGGGVHIVWGIFRVFHLYNCNEEKSFYLRLVIWSWYIGAIIGSCCAGYAVGKFRKGHLYLAGGTLLIVSGIFLMCSSNNTNIYLLISRIIGGFTQGLTYVVVIVHASDNATKEFREFLMLIVGAVLNYSILLSVLAFFHTEGLFRTGLLNGLGLIAFGLCTVLITTKHATETVPFILQNNGSELDALQTVSKLKKKPVSARSVHHDFLVMKNLVQDEIEHYGTPDFKKVLLPENRKSLIFCCYGRLCSVLSFNLPLIVMIMLFLRHWADSTFESHGIPAKIHCHTESIKGGNLTAIKTNEYNNDEIEIKSPLERVLQKRHADDFETSIEKPKSVEPKTGEGKENNEKSSKNAESQTEKEKSEENEKHLKKKHDEEEELKKKEMKENKESGKEKDAENKSDTEKEKKTEDEKNKIDEKHHANEENVHEQHHGKSTKPQQNDLKQSKAENDEEAKSKAEQEKLSKEKEREKKPKTTENIHHKHAADEEKNSKVNENGHKDHAELNGKKSEEFEKHEREKLNVEEVAAPTFFAHLIIFLHSRELSLVLLAWFIFGTISAAVLYTFNLKRFIYYVSCVLSSVLALTGIAHSFHLLSGILHFCLIVYFNYVTIPIDVFGHCMLAEAFPVTLKPFSVASVAIIEHLVHIIIITLYLSDWFHDSILLFMCIVAFISHEIARNLPQKGNLSLAEAREQYQNIDLMLFNEPKTGYNQQQEFI